jgi:membrane AbrB-like protein
VGWWVLFPAAAAGALLLALARFPAAPLIGALVGTSLVTVLGKGRIASPPASIANLAQIGIGMVIGVGFNSESLRAVVSLLGPVVAVTAVLFAASAALALLTRRLFGWTFFTGFLAVIPGGLSAMLILSQELSEDVAVVTTLQTLRLLTAVLVIPGLYALAL